ncbi:SAM-dependent methyltransferase [Candidatus Omnitrophota bacterium]
MNRPPHSIASSFRDPSGYIFEHNHVLYRAINQSYKDEYISLMQSGLYETLVKKKMLIPHQEVDLDIRKGSDAYVIIQPEKIPFITYPYEWSFNQLKDAALLTLAIQREALMHGMSLKDSSAYNIQLHHGSCIFIDTLSFNKYEPATPWVAYRQFCQHFIAPLALMAYTDIRLQQLLKVYLDGIPISLAASLLPLSSYMSISLIMHIHLHAAFESRAVQSHKQPHITMSRDSLPRLIDSLEHAIKKLRCKHHPSSFTNYYQTMHYSDDAFEHKKQIITDCLQSAQPKMVWDIGANIGLFSHIAAPHVNQVIAFDADPMCIDILYNEARKDNNTNIIPLVLDITNPSPSLGWAHVERSSLIERGPADMVFALALIHHLRITHAIPFHMLASFFRKIARTLIIEFVPDTDPMVQSLLTYRINPFDDYCRECFEAAFTDCFHIHSVHSIRDSERILYVMN